MKLIKNPTQGRCGFTKVEFSREDSHFSWERAMSLRHRNRPRRGAALVEAAVVLPVMMFLIGIAVDYSRIIYSTVTLSGSSRNGAMYEFDPCSYGESNYTSYSNAAQADASNLGTNVTFSKTTSTSANGTTTVTIKSDSTFQLLSSWFILPSQKSINRTIAIRQAQLVPD